MIQVPENTIIAIGDSPAFMGCHKHILESLAGNPRRDWFVKHAYHCLPLTVANQYGFAIKSLYTFRAIWDGGDEQRNVQIEILGGDGTTPEHQQPCQFVNSHFGMGTVTIQNRFVLRTPPGVNLMTINPPNIFVDGVHHMSGVIESDNLRRDFTFNLKLTRPNHPVTVNQGDYIGCVLPVPRYFQDRFQIQDGADVYQYDQLQNEHKTMLEFGVERRERDPAKPHGNGKRYFHGEDIWGNRFLDHQKTVRRPPK